jgi:hypothetical protein
MVSVISSKARFGEEEAGFLGKEFRDFAFKSGVATAECTARVCKKSASVKEDSSKARIGEVEAESVEAELRDVAFKATFADGCAATCISPASTAGESVPGRLEVRRAAGHPSSPLQPGTQRLAKIDADISSTPGGRATSDAVPWKSVGLRC